MSTRAWLRFAAIAALSLGASGCRDAVELNSAYRVGEWDLYWHVDTRWYRSEPGYGAACPTVAGNVAVFGTEDGRLVGRDRNTGAQQWRSIVNSGRYPVDAPLLTVDGVVVALVGDETSGIDPATGQVLWTYGAPRDSGGFFDNPAGPGYLARNVASADRGVVYIPAWGGSVSAVDVHTGATRWIWKLQTDTTFGAGAAGTTVAGDTVYASLWENINFSGTEVRGWLVAIDRGSGRTLSRTVLPFSPPRIGGRIVATPDVVVVTRGGAGSLAAVNRRDASVAWTFTSPGGWYASSSGVGGDAAMIFEDGGNDHFYALQPGTGAQVWENNFAGSPPTSPTASNRMVYLSNGWALSIFDRATGAIAAKVTQPGHSALSADGFIGCVTTAGNEVYATTDGGAWSFREP